MSIPIANLYYLLVYAWDVLDEADAAEVGAADIDVPVDLFGRLLRNGIDHVLKRGLDRGYASFTESIPGVRGRLDIGQTVKTASHRSGRLVCAYDELTYDVLHNQILKSTLLRMIAIPDLDRDLRIELRDLVRRFDEVSVIMLTLDAFKKVQLHANNRFYRLLMAVCRLLYRHVLPDPAGEGYRFMGFSDEQMQTVFEAFVRNFLAREQTAYQVKRERFRWQRVETSPEGLALLPTMETDVSLLNKQARVIVECKYYGKTLTKHPHSEGGSLYSSHLYQVFAYLTNLAASDGRKGGAVLLYPQTDGEIAIDYRVLGSIIRVATIDLAASPAAIGKRLLSCIDLDVPIGIERPVPG
jgi:5-methylcytosine-specific restriction enzyme subunit McrC